jgi:hypothetical protein
VRTGIAVIAFGFVIEKFNLFMLTMANANSLARVKVDWDGWNARSLAEEPIVRLILDGTVVRVRLDRKATSIALLVVLGGARGRPEGVVGRQEYGMRAGGHYRTKEPSNRDRVFETGLAHRAVLFPNRVRSGRSSPPEEARRCHRSRAAMARKSTVTN